MFETLSSGTRSAKPPRGALPVLSEVARAEGSVRGGVDIAGASRQPRSRTTPSSQNAGVLPDVSNGVPREIVGSLSSRQIENKNRYENNPPATVHGVVFS